MDRLKKRWRNSQMAHTHIRVHLSRQPIISICVAWRWRLPRKILRIACVCIVLVTRCRTPCPISPLEICSSVVWSYTESLWVVLKILSILAIATCSIRNVCKLLIPIQIGMLQLQTIDDWPVTFRWPYSFQEHAGTYTTNSPRRIEQVMRTVYGNMPATKFHDKIELYDYIVDSIGMLENVPCRRRKRCHLEQRLWPQFQCMGHSPHR